jgi:hypothetical protein
MVDAGAVLHLAGERIRSRQMSDYRNDYGHRPRVRSPTERLRWRGDQDLVFARSPSDHRRAIARLAARYRVELRQDGP